MDNFKLYKIICNTNMHVGDGDTSYDLIDNRVQRDVITNYPTINSSSLKGSIREFLKHKYDEDTAEHIFGSSKLGKGEYTIFQGMLLSIPMRSKNSPFYRVTCPQIINDFKVFIDNCDYKLDIQEKFDKFLEKVNEDSSRNLLLYNNNDNSNSEVKLTIEGADPKFEIINDNFKKDIESLFGENLVVINDKDFKTLIEELPVIARNKLENGESKNLWYEEIVPRESVFYFGSVYDEYDEKFDSITKEMIQIGGNATIGYGYCSISSINGSSGDKK